MDQVNNVIDRATDIAKTITKDKRFGAETRKAARAFLKKAKAKRENAIPTLVSAIASDLNMGPNTTLDDLDGALPPFFESTGAVDVPKDPSSVNEVAQQPEEVPSEASAPRSTGKGRQGAAEGPVPGGVMKGMDASDGAHLGDLVGWSLTGMCPQKKVEELVAKHGLTDDIRLPKLTHNSAYRKAIQICFNAGKKEDRIAMAVLVEDTAARIVHSLVNKNVVDDEDPDDTVSKKDAAFTTEIKVGFNKEADQAGATAGGCLMTEDDSHEAAKLLREKYAELTDNYLPDGIRSGFQVAFRSWDACPVLPHGGLWFVPARHSEKVRAWHQFMTDLGMKALIIPTFDTGETVESLRESTRNGLESQLAEVFNLLEEYSTLGWDKVRTSTMEKRMEDFEELRNRAELYQSILGTTINDLTARVQGAANTVMGHLTKKKAEEEEKARLDAEEKAREKTEREAAKAAKREEREAAKAAERAAEKVAKKVAKSSAA